MVPWYHGMVNSFRFYVTSCTRQIAAQHVSEHRKELQGRLQLIGFGFVDSCDLIHLREFERPIVGDALGGVLSKSKVAFDQTV